MIGALKTVQALIRKYSGPRNLETIPAEDWNNAVSVLMQNRPLEVRAGRPAGWAHPWEVSAWWDAALKAARFRVHPGFVSGRPPVVDMEPELAPEGFQDNSRRVRVPITEAPSPVIPSGAWRSIGSDAPPTGTRTTGAYSSELVFEPVPEYFRAFGVLEADPVAIGLSGGIQRLLRSGLAPSATLRRLRAVELVLVQPRPAVRAIVEPRSGLGGSFASIDITYSLPGDETPYVETLERFDPAPPPDEAGILAGAFQEEPFDKLHVATIYALSPPGEPEGAEVGAGWSFHVRQREFWNLNHATNRLPPEAPQTPLQWPIPLAGGAGTLAINTALAVVNDNAAEALAAIRGARIEGRFWTI